MIRSRIERVVTGPCLLLALFGLFQGMAWSAPRQELSLNGVWQVVKVRNLDGELLETGWQTVEVPGVVEGYRYARSWFRRSFTVPANWHGKRLFLRFGGVKYNSRVLVNGRHLGGCLLGYDAFELEITKAVRFGAENVLLIGVHDWTGLFDGEPVTFPSATMEMHALRSLPRDRILGPIGGQFFLYGLWDDVSLLVVPPVHFHEVFIRPSVRKGTLEVDTAIVNAGEKRFQGKLTARIFRWDGTPRDGNGQWSVTSKPAAEFPVVELEIPPGQSQSLTLHLDHPPLDLWWPHHPSLYLLEIRFEQSDTDVLRERFGFREFWTKNGGFYLNGAKVNLLGTSWWPPREPLSRSEIASQIRAIKKMNANCFRTHTQPWRERWYEAADELGLLMIPEGAVWNDDEIYRVHDPRFWRNYADHLRAMVRHLRNHPSVIMWSLENEFHGTRARTNTPVEKELARMGRIVKKEDPTRPITYESDGDPGGVSDVIGLHYPNEYPDRRLWPNDAYWMDAPRCGIGKERMFWKDDCFFWKRQKPLYIGEFLWAPSRDPSPQTIFYGDEAYIDHATYRARTKADAWRMQILAYRHYGVSGQSPWTVIEHGELDQRNPCWVAQRDLYRPLAAFIREHDFRFFSGETVHRTVEVFNDTMVDRPQMQMTWKLLDKKGALAGESKILSLTSGEHQELALQIPMPKVKTLTPLTLRLTLIIDGIEAFSEKWPVEVYSRPERWSVPKKTIFLFDPHGRLQKIWKRDQVAFQLLTHLEDWKGDGVLVVGPGALGGDHLQKLVPVIGGEAGPERLLAQRVEAGARVLVIEQDSNASIGLPAPLSRQSSTMAFPLMPSHPILLGLAKDAFRWWRGDNLVSRNEPLRPVRGAMRPLVVTGTAQGISHAPLLEIPEGSGIWLLCQLQVVSKIETEPMARILLERMLHYLATYSATQGSTLCLGPPDLQKQLTSLGVEWRPLKDLGSLRWPEARLLIMEAADDTIARHSTELARFLMAGGWVFWHRPQLAGFNETLEALDIGLQIHPYEGPVFHAEGKSPWQEALTREDLYWLDRPERPKWHPTPLATDTADGVFSVPSGNRDWRIIDVVSGVQVEGSSVRVQGNQVAFYTNGKASWKINLIETGFYQLGLVARGTPVGGIYPKVEIQLDERRIGIVSVDSTEPSQSNIGFQAEAGPHRLTVFFSNDAHAPPEDRNLFVERLMWAYESENSAMEAMTVPAALVRMPLGNGQLLLNSIRWDEPGGNAIKARRFICSLLTALGARFGGSVSDGVVEAENLEPQAHLPYFRRTADHVILATNGYIHGPVRIAHGGWYRVALWARGTQADGEYPLVALKLDGKEIGRFEVTNENWSPHYLQVKLPDGTFDLSLHFINDLYRPPEDRNLWIDRLEFLRIVEGMWGITVD